MGWEDGGLSAPRLRNGFGGTGLCSVLRWQRRRRAGDHARRRRRLRRHEVGGDFHRPHDSLRGRSRGELAGKRKRRGFWASSTLRSRRAAGAQNGQLTIMCGGDERDYAQASGYRGLRPLFPAHGSGRGGTTTKMVIRSGLRGLCRPFPKGLDSPNWGARSDGRRRRHFERRSAVLADGNRHKTMIARRFDFVRGDWMVRTLRSASTKRGERRAAAGDRAGDQFDRRRAGGGWRPSDTSSLITRLRPSGRRQFSRRRTRDWS